MTTDVRALVQIRGRVQGVSFRAFTQERARELGLRGGVRNLPDGRVEALIQGPRDHVLALIDLLKQGPRLARVEEVAIEWIEPVGDASVFRIWP